MVEKPNKLQPALVGGIVLGLLSSIPFVNLANVCCCLWVLLGGALASRMLIKRSPVLPVTMGDGAVTGVLAGVVGAIVYLIIGVPLALLMGEGFTRTMYQWMAEAMNDPNVRQQIEAMLAQMENQTFAQRLLSALVGWLMYAVLFVAFGALGGIIGVALFEKRKGQPPAGPQGYPPPAGFDPQGYPPPGPPPGGPGGPGEPPRY